MVQYMKKMSSTNIMRMTTGEVGEFHHQLSEGYFSGSDDLTDETAAAEDVGTEGGREYGFLLQLKFCHIEAFKTGPSPEDARKMLISFHEMLTSALVLTHMYTETGKAMIQLNDQKLWNRWHNCMLLGLE